jgi:Bacterial regulatory protein, Fis family
MRTHAPISSSSRRRLARWLVGSPISVVERDLILETLALTHGNRTLTAQLLGVSVPSLRNKISEYSAEGFHIPRHERRFVAKGLNLEPMAATYPQRQSVGGCHDLLARHDGR